jgi:hypothetical protein
MAIHDDNNTNQNQSSMGAAYNAASGNTGSNSEQQKGGTFSFRNMGGFTKQAMGRSPQSELLSKLVNALTEVYKGINQSYEYTLLPIDMNDTRSLTVSVLVLAMREKADAKTVAFHTLILEGSTEQPAPRFENINGQNVEIMRTVGEAYDDEMRKVVSEKVAATFPQAQQLPVEACVVPRDFALSDSNALYRLAANAAFATSSELEQSRTGFQDINLANAEKDSSLTVRPTFNNTQTVNAVNQPLRSDVQIDVTAGAANQSNNAQGNERVAQLAKLTGFIDLVWAPAEPQNTTFMGYGQQQSPQSFQKYAARFVLTSLESQSALTIAAQAFALVPALTMRENNLWAGAFRPTGFGEASMHDIGGVGIEANFENNPSGVGTRIDTRADNFKPEHLVKLIGATIKPGLILSIDVAECGPETWYNSVFAAAAAGNPNANKALYNAFQTLSNGNFGKHFQGNNRIVVDEDNRIHLGYYTDKNGVRKDLREIDYLAVVNMVGEKDPNVIRQWSDTFFPTAPLPVRLANRKRILMALLSDVVFTGYARRVTFEGAAIDALAKAVQETGVSFKTISPFADTGSFERSSGSNLGSTLMSSDSTGLFNRGGFNSQTTFGANRAFGSRW